MKKIMIIVLTLVLILGTVELSSGKNKIGLSIGTFYSMALPQKGDTNGNNNHFSLTGGFRSRFDTIILNTDIDYQSENEDITYIITSRISLLKEILRSGFFWEPVYKRALLSGLQETRRTLTLLILFRQAGKYLVKMSPWRWMYPMNYHPLFSKG